MGCRMHGMGEVAILYLTVNLGRQCQWGWWQGWPDPPRVPIIYPKSISKSKVG